MCTGNVDPLVSPPVEKDGRLARTLGSLGENGSECRLAAMRRAVLRSMNALWCLQVALSREEI